jgi:hypothetical protein
MLTPHQPHQAVPVPKAYDGYWLELLENPAASEPAPGGAAAGDRAVPERGDGAPGGGLAGAYRAD